MPAPGVRELGRAAGQRGSGRARHRGFVGAERGLHPPGQLRAPPRPERRWRVRRQPVAAQLHRRRPHPHRRHRLRHHVRPLGHRRAGSRPPVDGLRAALQRATHARHAERVRHPSPPALPHRCPAAAAARPPGGGRAGDPGAARPRPRSPHGARTAERAPQRPSQPPPRAQPDTRPPDDGRPACRRPDRCHSRAGGDDLLRGVRHRHLRSAPQLGRSRRSGRGPAGRGRSRPEHTTRPHLGRCRHLLRHRDAAAGIDTDPRRGGDARHLVGDLPRGPRRAATACLRAGRGGHRADAAVAPGARGRRVAAARATCWPRCSPATTSTSA